MAMPEKERLHDFLRAQTEALSVPFLCWVADQEAVAVGEQKRVLAGICEELVIFREQLDEDRMGDLYSSTLAALTHGAADPGTAALALAASPDQYAAGLAELVTGSPVRTEGYDPVYDVLLKVAPPAALTPEGVRRGHELATDLALDLRGRRKRSVQSLIGRAQLTPEQADQLLAGSNASRILDMVLALPSTADRLACLPDCFTPPPPPPPPPPGAAGAEEVEEAEVAAASDASEAEEMLWCTPSQLLVELDARLQRLEGKGPRPPEPAAPQQALPRPHSLSGELLLAEMRLLREEVGRTWLDSLERKATP